MKKALIALAGAGLLASACAPDLSSQAVKQGATGAAIGAAAGAIIGNNAFGGSAGTGAAVGAAIGGTIGAVRGSKEDRHNTQQYRDSHGRYYYCYDNRQVECYWEDGSRRN